MQGFTSPNFTSTSSVTMSGRLQSMPVSTPLLWPEKSIPEISRGLGKGTTRLPAKERTRLTSHPWLAFP